MLFSTQISSLKIQPGGDFPGGTAAKTLCSQCRGAQVPPLVREQSHTPQLEILCATTKTWSSQIHIKKLYSKIEHGYFSL